MQMDYCFIKGGSHCTNPSTMFVSTNSKNHRNDAGQFDAVFRRTQNEKRDTQPQQRSGVSAHADNRRQSTTFQDEGISRQVQNIVNDKQQVEKSQQEVQDDAMKMLLSMLAEGQIDMEQLALLEVEYAQEIEMLSSVESVEILATELQTQNDFSLTEQLVILEKLYDLIEQMQLENLEEEKGINDELDAILALLAKKMQEGKQKIENLDDANTAVQRGIDQTAYHVNQHQAQQKHNQDIAQQEDAQGLEEDGILALKESEGKENYQQEEQQDEGDLNLQGKVEVINLESGKEEQLDMYFNDILEIKEETASVESVKKAVTMPSAERTNIFNQVVESAKVVLQEGKSEMTLQLKPEHLGRLSVEIVTERGIMMARFEAESQQVKEIIESNLSLLKDALESQGLNVQGFSVSVGQQNAQRQAFQQSSRAKTNKISSEEITRQNNQYSQESIVVNPYDISNSSIDFTA